VVDGSTKVLKLTACCGVRRSCSYVLAAQRAFDLAEHLVAEERE
jgi:hypothetical protein